MSDLESKLLSSIQALNACIWSNRLDGRTIEQWLKEFGDDCKAGTKGRLHALYLLSRFMYFGDEEVRALLRALFRDHFRYPIVADVRKRANDTRDHAVLEQGFTFELSRTRFLAMGNPSESGSHLLYHYRQENDLSSKQFISTHEIFDLTKNPPRLANPAVTRYVFIDDFCGTGSQGVRYSRDLVESMAQAARHAGVQKPQVAYHMLIGTSKGLQRVRSEAKFDSIKCVIELDETFRAFDATSRYFLNPPSGIDRECAHQLALSHGRQLDENGALGFDDSQLMLAFAHNTPNNTLPIFWHPGHETRTWHPVFRRYRKLATQVVPLRGD